MKKSPEPTQRPKTVVIAGAGGNIGSHFSPLAARLPGVGRVVLIDPDVYEEKNLRSQNITRGDLGRPKVDVVAERLKAVDPGLEVIAIQEEIQAVPLGLFQADVLVACLDSRLARRALNEIAWRLGVPWVDAAVRPPDLLARVNLYVPGHDLPCIECAWDDQHYAALEFRHPCSEDRAVVAETKGLADLGSLAAAYASIECRKILENGPDRETAGREILIEARHHRHGVTRFRRSPACRFDHETFPSVVPLNKGPHDMTVAELLSLTGRDQEGNALRIPGKSWMTRGTCRSCGRTEEMLYVLERLPRVLLACGDCGKPLQPVGFFITDVIRLEDLNADQAASTLESIGIRNRDILTVESATGEYHHFCVGAEDSRHSARAVPGREVQVS